MNYFSMKPVVVWQQLGSLVYVLHTLPLMVCFYNEGNQSLTFFAGKHEKGTQFQWGNQPRNKLYINNMISCHLGILTVYT